MHGYVDQTSDYFSICQQRLIILETVIVETADLLRSFRKRGEKHEGIVYWAGYETPQSKIVTTAIAPKASTTWGSFKTSEIDNAKVVQTLSNWKCLILGQVHSHPSDWVDHSDGDDEMAFMPFEGFFSVIVPNYARKGLSPTEANGFHVFNEGKFLRLKDNVIHSVVQILPARIDLRKKTSR